MMWHYHVTLECGHMIAFDVNRNLIDEAVMRGGEAEIEMPCPQCRIARRSTDLAVTEGRGPCPECGSLG